MDNREIEGRGHFLPSSWVLLSSEGLGRKETWIPCQVLSLPNSVTLGQSPSLSILWRDVDGSVAMPGVMVCPVVPGAGRHVPFACVSSVYLGVSWLD